MLRPLTAADAPEVAAIFRETIALGKPLPGEVPDFAAYEDFSLGWYLGPGTPDCAVVETEDRLDGYVLVCTDPDGFERHRRRAARRFLSRVGPRLALGRYPPFAARFYRLRLRDGWELWRRARRTAPGAHAHFNVRPGARSGLLVRDFVAHVDRVCAAAGWETWTGEMNSRGGLRSRVLERYGNAIVGRSRNHTLSWLAGEEVERLTVVRPIGDITRVDADPAVTPMVGGPQVLRRHR
jgi:hypothetical protein